MPKKQFKAESKRLLDLMINSIYTHKEIFLREIISNASDAIDKLCYLSLTDDKVGISRGDFKINIALDKDARLITVSDNGIGMNKEDLESNLGVIASSGSYKFRQEMDEKGDSDGKTDIIGQFGVGFYSAFMVADSITVVTKKYGEDTAYMWQSSGADGYTVRECEREKCGTDVIMHVRPDADDEKYGEFLDEYRIKGLVRKYSDYIRWPIQMMTTSHKRKEGSPDDKPEFEDVKELETLNSMIPLWQRPKKDVAKEEYDKFYQEKFFDYSAPQRVIPVSVEGNVTYKALLFIPSKTPYDFYTKDFEKGLQLYSGGVLIMDKCADLLPDYFRFVRGIVDSPDLSLNISREMLQHDRQLRTIAANLEKKIRAELEKMLKDEREEYEKFFKNFGLQLKYGVISDYGAHKDAIQDLLLFYSSTEKKPVTLDEYVTRMPESQKYIYYAAGDSIGAIDSLPQTELVKKNSMEILYFTNQADEFAAQALHAYKEKEFRSVLNDDLGLENDDAPKDEGEYKDVLEFVKTALGDKVKDVRISKKLVNHPVCLTAEGGISFEMEKYMAAVQPDAQMKAERVLELNAAHPAFKALCEAVGSDREKAEKYARILLAQAELIAGLPLENPSDYADAVCSLMA
ncbi:MAG: molecular chaperone HtpG [Oscillospiraceae bacterium]|nr:molecular chaperone HtpG [Oscillospiraceae bacterium]